MKKRLFLVVGLILLGTLPSHGEKISIRSLKDGSKMVETTFEAGDQEFKYQKKASIYDRKGYKIRDESLILNNDYNNLGIRSVVRVFDREGNIKELKVHFRENKALLAGYNLIELVYDERAVRRQMNVYYTDENPDERIYEKSISYYNMTGAKLRTVYYFMPKIREQTGFVRYEEEFNRKGNRIDKRFINTKGEIIQSDCP